MQQRRAAPDLVAKVAEGVTYSSVAPAWALPCHPDDELSDVLGGPRTPRTPAPATVVLPRDELPVPAQDRVWRDDAGNVFERLPADRLAPDGEAAAVGVGQSKTTSAELLSQDGVLLLQILNHIQLPAVDPASEEVQQTVVRYRSRFGVPTRKRVTPARQGVVHGGHLSR